MTNTELHEKLVELLMEKGFGVEGANIAADHLIANGVTLNQWIPVTERLPGPNVPVITLRESAKNSPYWAGFELLALFNGKATWSADCRYRETKVTHWMPLPEPPKEGNNA